jgi:hypothetical protein
VMTWRKRKPPVAAPAPAGAGPSDDEYLKRVEQEMEQDA